MFSFHLSRERERERERERGINTVVIVPAVLEATGRMGTELVQFLKRCGRKCGPVWAELRKQLSVTMAKGNARIVEEAQRRAYALPASWAA
jgi:hypothetical protein